MQYNLRATETHELTVNEDGHGLYKLVGVLMYKRGSHFMADVLDPREECWLRYDGMCANGVGQPIPTPSGAVWHASIPEGKESRFYPILTVYARC